MDGHTQAHAERQTEGEALLDDTVQQASVGKHVQVLCTIGRWSFHSMKIEDCGSDWPFSNIVIIARLRTLISLLFGRCLI